MQQVDCLGQPARNDAEPVELRIVLAPNASAIAYQLADVVAVQFQTLRWQGSIDPS